MDKTKVLELVNKICNIESTECRSLNKSELARELLNLANVPQNADIQEIPLDWNNQVAILFLLPNDVNYYSLFAGIGKDKEFHFELAICGQLEGKDFNFYNEDKVIDINYFKGYDVLTKNNTQESKEGSKMKMNKYEKANKIEKQVRETKAISFKVDGKQSDIKIKELYNIEIYPQYTLENNEYYDIYLEYKNVYNEYKNIRLENKKVTF